MNSLDIKFLDLLVDKKIITIRQAEDIKEDPRLKDPKNDLQSILVSKHISNNEELTKIKAMAAGMDYADLSDISVPEQILNTISFDIAENYEIICFKRDKSLAYFGVIDPYNFKAVEAINFLAHREGWEAKFSLISKENFNKVFRQYQNLEKEVSAALEIKEEETGDAGLISLEDSEAVAVGNEDDIHSAPVAKIVSVIIRHAVDGMASDIHIEPLETETRIRYRVDGILRTSLTLPRKVHSAIVGRIKVLAKLKLDETRIPQGGRIRLLIGSDKIDFRVSTMPLMRGEKVEMRILNLGQKIPTLEDLGYFDRNLDVINENIKKTYGVLLITGPTGSGKSTTLASILNILNKEGVNIATLEDPIEYYLEGINQSQVRPDIGYTFASGLRSLLRQDPDVLMVGEIRDLETAELCIQAGLTGHIVLATLHSNTALDAVPRLIDMKIEPFLLGSTLHTVVAQRLVRKICPKCKKKFKLSDKIKQKIMEDLNNIPREEIEKRTGIKDINNITFYKGEGCNYCSKTGYKGRTAIVEVLNLKDKIKEFVVNKGRILKLSDVKKDQNFITLKQDGMIKAIQGITTIEEVLRVADD